MEIQRKAMQKLENLRERLLLAGTRNHNPELLVIANDLLEIKRMFLEEEKELLGKTQTLPSSIVTSNNIDNLDRDFTGGQRGI